MLDRLTGMQIFVRVAAAGSFSAAARALGLSQSGVTKHVAALEHDGLVARVDEVLGARQAGEAAAHDDNLLLLAHALELLELLGQGLTVAVVVRVLDLRGLGEVLGDDAPMVCNREYLLS